MASLDKEVEKLLAFLKTQPLRPAETEPEEQEKRDQGVDRIYNGETVKEAGNEKAHVQASAEIDSLLSRISSDCGYNDWFRVACALKHEGCAYEVFRNWSALAQSRFDEAACERTWNSIGEDHDAKISMGTLRWMAEKSILTEPRTTDEMAEQALDFIDNDELLEVTPKNLRIRKKILDPTLRKRAGIKKE